MKITYSIHQFFPNYYTGTELYLYNLATMMQKLGHEIHIITYNPANISQQQELIQSDYIYKNLQVTYVKCSNESSISFELSNSCISKYFSDLFKKEKPDLFHIAHPMRMASAFWEAKKKNIKTVITLTDYWLMCPKGLLVRNNNAPCVSSDNGLNCKKFCYRNLLLSRIQERVKESQSIIKNADALVASANYLADLFKFNGYDMSKLALIRHGFNYFNKFSPLANKKKKDFTIISTGSLLPHKGAHILIQAFKKLKQPRLKLKVYGSSYGDNSYMNFLLKLKGKDKRIIFPGTYTIDQTAKIHQEADIVVQPSLWAETYPLVCVASLAYGVPIIVPNATGSQELVNHGTNGYVFEFGNIDSLAKQLTQAYKDKLKFKNNIFYPYSIENEAVTTEQLYYQLLNK